MGNWSVPLFIDDWPAEFTGTPWTEQGQGIANDGSNWFFTACDSLYAPPLIVKIPVGVNPSTTNFGPINLDGSYALVTLGGGETVSWAMPDDLKNADSGFYHYGDLDQANGFLFVPVERGEDAGHEGLQAIAVFRAADLSYVGYAWVTQSSAAWVAWNEKEQLLYSSDEYLDSWGGNGLYRYTVDFNLLNQSLVQQAIQPIGQIAVANFDATALNPTIGFQDDAGDVGYVQGGVFSPWGDLYILSGDSNHDSAYQQSGIHLFRLDPDLTGCPGTEPCRYLRVADSVNGQPGFNYMHSPGQEPEGLDWWWLTLPTSPVPVQLHAMLLNNKGEIDSLWLKHYNVNYPPEADAGDDQTVNEGDEVTLNGTYTDVEGATCTFLWELVSATNGQPVSSVTTQSLIFKPWDNGVYVFRFTVTDDQGAQGSDTVTVTSLNVAPTITALYISDQPNAEFILPVVHDLVFRGDFTDPGIADTHTALWSWGDGADSTGDVYETDGSGYATRHHTYASPGDYVVALVVTDDDGGPDVLTMNVHVAGVGEALDVFDAYVQSLPDSLFKNNAQQRKANFHNGFETLDHMLAAQAWQGMISSMNGSLRPRFDGLLGGNANDDWIVADLAAQQDLCQKVDDITAYLSVLLGQ